MGFLEAVGFDEDEVLEGLAELLEPGLVALGVPEEPEALAPGLAVLSEVPEEPEPPVPGLVVPVALLPEPDEEGGTGVTEGAEGSSVPKRRRLTGSSAEATDAQSRAP